MSEYLLNFEELIPVDRSSECHMDICWLILKSGLVLDGISSMVVQFLVSSCCVAGAIAETVNLVNLVHPPSIDGLFGEDAGFEIHGFT